MGTGLLTFTTRASLVALCLLLVACDGRSDTRRYRADRFDSQVEVLPGGAMRVTETVTFRFEGGPFREVFRELPTRRTDGIRVEMATMDGEEIPFGVEAGRVEVRQRDRVRVTWRFPPMSDTTREFGLTYVMNGVVRDEGDADVLIWRALPTDHRYSIASSTIELQLPSPPLAKPAVTSRRTERTAVMAEAGAVRVDASGIRRDGWVELRVAMPARSVLATPPRWQQRVRARDDYARVWLLAGVAIAGAGVLLLLALRRTYDAPPRHRALPATGAQLPGREPPAQAGALASQGSVRVEHAMATLFDLAERGVLSIREERRSLGRRRFVLTRHPTRRLAAWEETLLDIIFTKRGERQTQVTLDTARSRLTSRVRRFASAVRKELLIQGLLEPGRVAVAHRFEWLIGILLVTAVVVGIALAVLAGGRHGAWPQAITGALVLAGIVAAAVRASITPLSNEGVRRGQLWRRYRTVLKDAASGRGPRPADQHAALLPYVFALGAGARWGRYLKKNRMPVPAWFHPAVAGEGAPAFTAFVASGAGVSHGSGSGGGGGGSGGAAGGGGSGAG